MTQGYPVDYDAIHRSLWERSDRMNRVRIRQTDLMAEWSINKFTASRVVARLVEEGRIRQINQRPTRNGAFIVSDPDA